MKLLMKGTLAREPARTLVKRRSDRVREAKDVVEYVTELFEEKRVGMGKFAYAKINSSNP